MTIGKKEDRDIVVIQTNLLSDALTNGSNLLLKVVCSLKKKDLSLRINRKEKKEREEKGEDKEERERVPFRKQFES